MLAVSMTVTDRPHYFERVLDSWSAVRGIDDVIFIFNIEPTEHAGKNWSLVEASGLPNYTLFENQTKLGVLRNPYAAFNRSFALNSDYTILAEDDLLVSDDIIEYHKWASEQYEDDKDIAMVCSFFEHLSAPSLENKVCRVPNFASVWIWGTWRDRWVEYIGPTWDRDYSTDDYWTGPGGWDWNLNKRVLPKLEKFSIMPLTSRAQNIGQVGTHSQSFIQSGSFEAHREPTDYEEIGRE